jgi:hypothetical protein
VFFLFFFFTSTSFQYFTAIGMYLHHKQESADNLDVKSKIKRLQTILLTWIPSLLGVALVNFAPTARGPGRGRYPVRRPPVPPARSDAVYFSHGPYQATPADNQTGRRTHQGLRHPRIPPPPPAAALLLPQHPSAPPPPLASVLGKEP